MNYLPKSDNFPLESRQQLHNDHLLQPLSTSLSVNLKRVVVKTTLCILEKKALAWEHNSTTWAVPRSWRGFPIHVYDFFAPGSARFMFSFPDMGQEMKHFLNWFSMFPPLTLETGNTLISKLSMFPKLRMLNVFHPQSWLLEEGREVFSVLNS